MALQNAASVATLLLTTDALVSDMPEEDKSDKKSSLLSSQLPRGPSGALRRAARLPLRLAQQKPRAHAPFDPFAGRVVTGLQWSGMDPHELAQARSLALHRAVLERIEHDPSLLHEVRARLSAWRSDETKPQRYVEAWSQLLDGPREALHAVLTGDDEQARALRQATPFAGVVGPRERWRIWAEVKSRAARSA